MKKEVLTGAAVLVMSLTMETGCSDDPGFHGDGSTGKVVPTVSIDSRVNSSERGGMALSSPLSRASSQAMEITTEDLTLTMTPKDGQSEAFTCKGVSAFPIDKEFKVGEYTFEATYGDAEAEGFELPAYYGASTLVVEENRTSSVSLTAELINSMVSVEFGENLKSYATDLSAHVQTTGDKIAFTTTETRAAYVRPGTATVSVTLTKPNGVSGTVTIPAFTAKAKYHHHVMLDLSEGSGNAMLEVNFDETVESEDVEIELSDEILNAPAPTAIAQGFVSGEALALVAGLGIENPLTVDISAPSSIASVVMNTTSASLTAQGWPTSIDLTKATAEQQTLLKGLGLDVLGLFKNPGRMAVIDFTGILPHIRYTEGGDNMTEISLTILDEASKSAEPVVLKIDAQALELGLQAVSTAYPDAAGDPIDLLLTYNGPDPKKDVSFEYSNERGTWDKLEVISIEPAGRAGESYAVSVKAPDIDFSVEIRAVCGALQARSESVIVKQVPFRLLTSDAMTYAHSTTLTVVSSTLNGASVAQNGTLKLTPEAPGMTVSVDGAELKVSGLAAGTTYTASFVYEGDECRQITFTTEQAAQLPDSGFDTWNGQKLENDCYQYLWTVGDGSTWGTLNPQTTSQHGNGVSNGTNCKGAAYKATSGTIPANGRSTKSQDGGGSFGTSKSGDGHTTGNATLLSGQQHSGDNAALIRTVGWGSGTAAPSVFTPNGSYDNLTPGELFLGSEATEGYAFASRPTGVKFAYRYNAVDSSNGDYGTFEAYVLDASGAKIATIALTELTVEGTWTEKTLPFNYSIADKKAARLCIVFKSSGNPSALVNDSKYITRPGRNNISGGEYVGSELYIDDVELIY